MGAHLTSSLGKKQSLLGILGLICSFLTYFLLPDFVPEAGKRVASVFVFAVFFWALELIPLYATSLLIVILLTFLLTKPGGVLGLDKTGYHLFLVPFSSPVIMLFLGGFILAAAVRKHHVDVYLVKEMLARVGHKSWALFLGFLFLSAFFSMWISNTAATAMLLALLKPVLDGIEENDPLRKGLVLAVAFGANIGGIGTPIGTPPNAIALGILADEGIDITFAQWMLVAIPFACVILALTAGILYMLFPPKSKAVSYQVPGHVKLSGSGLSVVIIALFMILLWITKPLHQIPEALVALLGVGLFATFQLISKEDFKHINWDILVLMWGGLALGEAIQISGLVEALTDLPQGFGESFWLICILSLLALVLSSFISNTATANLLIPLSVSIIAVDQSYFTLTIAFACSLALAFPISTPPNAMAYGTGWIQTKEMARAGGLISGLALAILLLAGRVWIPLALST